MIASRLRPLPLLALALLAAPLAAQEVVQPLPGTTDADALAAEMRTIAANPRDVDALVDAARLSLKLDDIRAAGALLQRAENVSPRDPRVKAGQASVLVESERPGQALRYFAEAEAQGLDPRVFAADRGLAYDLTGQQERAQRDYALALRTNPDDETVRRYALSLGISGQRQRALQLLDPLVRKSDRAAWRAQAFVLAMTGDIGGAQRIAATMMPGGASGLSAFFERLPTLPATDRAFAVHFGEVRPTPERLADARLAPAAAPLQREPVALASAAPALPVQQQVQRTRSGRSRDRDASTFAAPSGLAGPPQRTSVSETRVATVSAAPLPAQPQVEPSAQTILAAAREPSAGTRVTTTLPSALPASAANVPVRTESVPAPVQLAAAAPVASLPVRTMPTTVAPQPQPRFEPQPVATVALPPSAPVVVAARPVPTIPRARTPREGDAILAKIVAGLSIPGSELGIDEPARPVVASPPAAVAPGRSEASPSVQADRAALDRIAAAREVADRKAADRKAAAERKALADRKAAAEKKALADKEAAEKKRVERANPSRIWVQVAGGAYEGDLPKAYAAVKAKAPAVFGSRAGYTTPLRATNRVLTGPFKTDAEARAFVNDLGKQGIGAFTFNSDPGQPVARLGSRGKADDDAPVAKDSARDKSDAKPAVKSRRKR